MMLNNVINQVVCICIIRITQLFEKGGGGGEGACLDTCMHILNQYINYTIDG